MRTIIIAALLIVPALCLGQTVENAAVRSSAAYAELIVRKTEVQADLEAVAADYTEANPKLLDLRFELSALERSLVRILATKPSETAKLTLAIGKLLVKKAALETEQARLIRSYGPEHPEVKRAKRRVEIFENAILELTK